MSSPCILYSDYDLLREVATLSRDACHDTGDIQGTAAMISVLAYVEMDLCEWGSSKTLYTTAYELFAEAGDLLGEAFAATFAADSARMIFQYDNNCDLDEVRLWSHRAAALCEKVDDPYRKTDVAYVLGKFFLATGELDRAREQFEAVLHQASALGKPVSQAHALFRLGNVAQRTGQRSHALTAYHRALQICKEVGHRLGVGYITLALAELHAERAERREALNYARTALSTFRELQLRKKADETYLLLKKLTLRWP
jgi:tetratricopeptide (TPR) repeat protein